MAGWEKHDSPAQVPLLSAGEKPPRPGFFLQLVHTCASEPMYAIADPELAAHRDSFSPGNA